MYLQAASWAVWYCHEVFHCRVGHHVDCVYLPEEAAVFKVLSVPLSLLLPALTATPAMSRSTWKSKSTSVKPEWKESRYKHASRCFFCCEKNIFKKSLLYSLGFIPCPQLHGKLRVILEPLIGDLPLIGAITMFFIRRPVSDITQAQRCQDTFQFLRVVVTLYCTFLDRMVETGHQLDWTD